ncbi:DUF6924 domain-containing protein [Streptomyces laurentii]|uniref:DUF6924 domain-containing protein n=1 Tax=Streptomyces laurentii TaxID=39478 RepID=UPI0036D1CD10
MTMPDRGGRVLPESTGHDPFDALVIRTDFGDDASWHAVVEELLRPWGPDGAFPPRVRLIDAPAWSGATADDVLAAVGEDDDLGVVFLADRATRDSPARALLALTTIRDDDGDLDPVHYQDLIDAPEPREFRAAPAAIHGIHVNVALGNLDFAEFAAAAAKEPDRVLRPF